MSRLNFNIDLGVGTLLCFPIIPIELAIWNPSVVVVIGDQWLVDAVLIIRLDCLNPGSGVCRLVVWSIIHYSMRIIRPQIAFNVGGHGQNPEGVVVLLRTWFY